VNQYDPGWSSNSIIEIADSPAAFWTATCRGMQATSARQSRLPDLHQHLQHVARFRQSVPQQPAADYGAGPAYAAPAVDVDRFAGGYRFVDGVQDGGHHFGSRCGQVADGMAATACVWAELPGQVLVRRERLAGVVRVVFLHQVDECADAGVDQSLDLGPVCLRVRITGVSTGQQAAGYDPVAGRGGRGRVRVGEAAVALVLADHSSPFSDWSLGCGF
jgi:hypothetical protein